MLSPVPGFYPGEKETFTLYEVPLEVKTARKKALLKPGAFFMGKRHRGTEGERQGFIRMCDQNGKKGEKAFEDIRPLYRP
jgi:hypothetical protein